MTDTDYPDRCETDGCHRKVQSRVDYFARTQGMEESGPTYRCEPCATAFQEGSLAGRSDTTIQPLPEKTK